MQYNTVDDDQSYYSYQHLCNELHCDSQIDYPVHYYDTASFDLLFDSMWLRLCKDHWELLIGQQTEKTISFTIIVDPILILQKVSMATDTNFETLEKFVIEKVVCYQTFVISRKYPVDHQPGVWFEYVYAKDKVLKLLVHHSSKLPDPLLDNLILEPIIDYMLQYHSDIVLINNPSLITLRLSKNYWESDQHPYTKAFANDVAPQIETYLTEITGNKIVADLAEKIHDTLKQKSVNYNVEHTKYDVKFYWNSGCTIIDIDADCISMIHAGNAMIHDSLEWNDIYDWIEKHSHI